MSEYHDRTIRLVADRTCEWILSHNAFVDWQSQLHTSDRRVLITHGRAGCGKSVLSSSIFDMLRGTNQQASERAKNSLPTENTQQLPVFFAFSATDTSRQTIESFLRSFLAQLVDFDQDNRMISLLSHLAKKSSTSRADILSGLLEALDSVEVTAIVDGTDECSDNSDELFHVLHTLYLKSPRLKFLLIGQTHSFTNQFDKFSEPFTIAIRSQHNQEDIQRVINTELQAYPPFWTPKLRDLISRALNDKADGMFLWVKLMLDYLRFAPSEGHLYQCLKDLPGDLEHAYSLICTRMLARLQKHQLNLVQWILAILSACGQPLSYEELQAVYALSNGETSKISEDKGNSFKLHLAPDDLIGLCGGLIAINNDRFSIVHNSAKEFLTCALSRPSSPRNDLDVFKVDLARSHQLFGDIFFKLFELIQKEALERTSVDQVALRNPILDYAHSYACDHMRSSGMNTPMRVYEMWKCQIIIIKMRSSHASIAYTDEQRLSYPASRFK
jgi:hypothetical protein